MSKVTVNYDLLMDSAEKLESLEQTTTDTTLNQIETCLESIKTLSNKHDSCFSSVSFDSINDCIEQTGRDLLSLSQKAGSTVNIFSEAETYLDDQFHITSTGLRNVYKRDFKNNFNHEITEGYDYEYYQRILDDMLNNVSDTRSKTVVASLFLATAFPHLPYFWGGGHEYISDGVDPAWGSPKVVTAGGSDTTGKTLPNSVDCSGYVSWSLKNGGYDIDKPMVTTELKELGTTSQLKGSSPQTGDFAYMDGHIGMVVNVEGSKATVTHCSGSGGGMNITTLDTKTGLVIEDATNPERVGKEYFDQIVHIDYE